MVSNLYIYIRGVLGVFRKIRGILEVFREMAI